MTGTATDYEKIPVHVQAIQYDGSNLDQILLLLGMQDMNTYDVHLSRDRGMLPGVVIRTSNSSYCLTVGMCDWVLIDTNKLSWTMTDREFRTEYQPRTTK